MEIDSTYLHMKRRVSGSQPQVQSHFQRSDLRCQESSPERPQGWKGTVNKQIPCPAPSLAQKLSENRARKRALADPTLANHISNIYHMHRRIEEISCPYTARAKPTWAVGPGSAMQRRTVQTSMPLGVASWMPQRGARPAGRPNTTDTPPKRWAPTESRSTSESCAP
ncbi:hypothetical protein WJX72_010516 [[Myrmecia] bisecta]|uniref:Uncharacterized protein n=1 Tax=[Myrmecia] bisecta TaxID=41462 RepID=A0AAW1PXT0_9CHLO